MLRYFYCIFLFVFVLGCENSNKNNNVLKNNLDGRKNSAVVDTLAGSLQMNSQLAVVSGANGEKESPFTPFDVYTDIGS